MKSIDPRFAGSLVAEGALVAEATVWTLAYGNAVFRFLNYTQAFQLDVGDGAGTVWFEPFAWKRGSMDVQGDLQVDRVTLDLPNVQLLVQYSTDAQKISLADLCLNGVLDRASVSLYIVNLRNGASELDSVWDVVGQPTISRATVQIQMQSAMGRGIRRCPRTIVQEGCSNALFDLNTCGLAIAGYISTGTVTGTIAGYERVYMETALAQADDYFALGKVTFISGLNVGATRTIGWHNNAGGAVKWPVPLLYGVAAGDRFEIVPGCDKTWATCSGAKFANNSAQFRGFPSVPRPETVL